MCFSSVNVHPIKWMVGALWLRYINNGRQKAELKKSSKHYKCESNMNESTDVLNFN